MYIPRRLQKGAEYDQSVAEARGKGLAKFAENLAAVRNVAKFEPEVATQVQDSELRIAQIYDEVNGYSLALYFCGGVSDSEISLKQIQVFEIEPDFAPWDY
jgi:hypothetical protein